MGGEQLVKLIGRRCSVRLSSATRQNPIAQGATMGTQRQSESVCAGRDSRTIITVICLNMIDSNPSEMNNNAKP